MNINLQLTGELEQFVNSLIKRGLAANKTEAIRMMAVEYIRNTKKLNNNEEYQWQDKYVDYIDKKRIKTKKELLEAGIVSEADFV